MRNKIALFTLISSISLNTFSTEISEFTGKISNIYIGKSDTIKIGVTEDEQTLIDCNNYDNEQWLMHFDGSKPYATKWFETLNLVRRTQETIRIGYTPNEQSTCDIEYLALLQGDGNSSGIDPIGDNLTRSGYYGNIALIYTNNLTESNFTSSTHDRNDSAPSAFDGHTWTEQV